MSNSWKRSAGECCVYGVCFALLVCSSLPAFAHHMEGGKIPQTLVSGMLSGLGHPIIGLDHFAFIVAVGIASASLSRGAVPILGFVLATIFGCGLHLQGMTLPMSEIAIAGSALMLGAVIMFGQGLSSSAASLIFSVAGVFHGYAYGEAIFGAEQMPIAAYLTGFGSIQFLLAFSAMLITRAALTERGAIGLPARFAGAAIAGIGITFLLKNSLPLILSPAALTG